MKAAESALIADLTTDSEVRIYNSRLTKDLRDAAERLRRHWVAAMAAVATSSVTHARPPYRRAADRSSTAYPVW
jgi:hypothetical protein